MWTSDHSLLWQRAATLACAALAAACLGPFLAARRARPPALWGDRGRRREEWLASGGLASAQDLAVRWVAGAVVVGLPPGARRRLSRSLSLAAHPWGFGPEELVAASLSSGVLGLVAAWALAPTLGWPAWLLALLSPALPGLHVRLERNARVTAVERGLPIAMDLIALCVRAGGDFPSALGFVVRELQGAHPACTRELARIEEALAVGRTRVDALEGFGASIDSPAVSRFVGSLVQSERRGIPLADALTQQAEVLRQLRSVRAEESAARAGVRMVVPLMLMLGAILSLLLGPMVIDGVQL